MTIKNAGQTHARLKAHALAPRSASQPTQRSVQLPSDSVELKGGTPPQPGFAALTQTDQAVVDASTASLTPPMVAPALFGGEMSVAKEALQFHSGEAFQVMDSMLAAKDPVTGLLPLNFETRDGRTVASDHVASGLDSGRTTAGLVMTAEVAQAVGDTERHNTYIEAAEENYARSKELLTEGDVFVHLRDFNEDGTVKSTNVGEPGKSAEGQDNATRVNPRGYAFRGAAELYRVTGKEQYKDDFNRYFQAWVSDFHDPVNGGFFLHSNVEKAGDHQERGSFRAPGGADSSYTGEAGVKGNDGTIYALSGVLLAANEVLGTEQTQGLVKEQMDILLDKFHRQDGMQWENYTADFQPISQDWQNQPRDNGENSHVAIGGHTAMAAQQIIEGARQLKAQGAIDQGQYNTYIDRSVEMFGDFAANSGAVDWETGAVHNAIRVEEPDAEKRWISAWGDAPWQQAELLQSLVRLGQEGRLKDIKGPDDKNGVDLLQAAQDHYRSAYALPAENYKFRGFGNPDVYHRPQVAQYFSQVAGGSGR